MRRSVSLGVLGVLFFILTACPSREVKAQGPIVTPAGTSASLKNSAPVSSRTLVSPPAADTTLDSLSPNPGVMNMSSSGPRSLNTNQYSTPFDSEFAHPNAMNAIATPPGVLPRVDDMNRPNSNTGQNDVGASDVNAPGSRGAGLSPF